MKCVLLALLLLFFTSCGDIASSQSNNQQQQSLEPACTCCDTCGPGNEDIDICDCEQSVTESGENVRLITDCTLAGGSRSSLAGLSFGTTCEQCNDGRLVAGCFDTCAGCE